MTRNLVRPLLFPPLIWRRPSPTGSVVGGVTAFGLAFLVVCAFRVGEAELRAAWSNIAQVIIPLFAAWSAFSFARSLSGDQTRERGAWIRISAACASFAAGQAAWTTYENIFHQSVPLPSVADLGYLTTYPLLLSGCIRLLHGTPGQRFRLLLDSAVVASSVGVLVWHFLVQPLWLDSSSTVAAKLVAAAYPLGDLAVLVLAVALLREGREGRVRADAVCIAAGAALLAIADSGFTFYTLAGSYRTGGWVDPIWSLGWLAIGHAARHAGAVIPARGHLRVSADAAPHRSRGRLLLALAPYAAVAIAFLVVSFDELSQRGAISLGVFLLGVGVTSLVIARQVLSILHNQDLAAQLQRLNEHLEDTVTDRTRQLSAMRRLACEISGLLHPERVLETSIVRLRELMGADLVAISVLDPTSETPETSGRFFCSDPTDPNASALQGALLAGDLHSTAVRRFVRRTAEQTATVLVVPVRWMGQYLGRLGLVQGGQPVDASCRETVESIGFEIGTAYMNALLYRQARTAADLDAVTGLLNHRAIHARFDEALWAASEGPHVLSVVMIDLDNFKLFNDTYGHPVGDRLLKEVSQVLSGCPVAHAEAARYGGDEFLLLLPNLDSEGARAVAVEIREQMRERAVPAAPGRDDVPVNLCFGIATYPHDGTSRYDLLTMADAHLYTAKAERDGIVSSSPSQRETRRMMGQDSFSVLDAMVTAIDNKDRYTRRHSEDVTEYALWIAESLGLSEETLRLLRLSAMLHDIGKIGVPDEILRRPGRLAPEEYRIMQQHPELGALMVGALVDATPIVEGVRSHHERWDGDGYPDRLRGEAIPLFGRIIGVADAFSAMTTDRPYRRGKAIPDALEEIARGSGSQFDPTLAGAFLKAARSRWNLESAGNNAAASCALRGRGNTAISSSRPSQLESPSLRPPKNH